MSFFLTASTELDQTLYDKVVFTVRFAILVHCILVDSSTVIYWTSHFSGARSILSSFIAFLIENPNSKQLYPHQTPHDMGLHCLPMIRSARENLPSDLKTNG